ncbi:hypothetical protein CHU32_02775 [Superficieibacter electus]|uniref:Uncharacterized protein n=1 Tax=Superficieibacter electus TaxID=2022662 RepID=A0A2P5GUY4_9ENTR|nr:hypothetical protein CHU33_12885 [Superficieibacter electus]POP50366.1 hypothetical protein CHU32_02775 [Superficieibacter electus]
MFPYNGMDSISQPYGAARRNECNLVRVNSALDVIPMRERLLDGIIPAAQKHTVIGWVSGTHRA